MAGATLQEIREGIADTLNDAFAGTVQCLAYETDQPTPPTIQVLGMEQVLYDRASVRGVDEWTILIEGLAGPTMDQGSQSVLDSWLTAFGPSSVKAILETNRTLGSKILDLNVFEAGSYRKRKLDDQTIVRSCQWQVRVLNRGT